MEPLKITLVCQYFPPESNAPAVRTFEHARQWARAGHQVTVITGFPNHPGGVVFPGYRGEWFRRERVEGIEVLRTWLYTAPNRGVVKRVVSFLSFAASSVLLGFLRGRRPDVVVGTSPQFFSAVAGYCLSLLHRVPFVFELRDIWPDTALQLGVITNRVALKPVFALQRHLYRRAKKIIIVSEGFRTHLREAGVPSERIAYVPNGIDPSFLTVSPNGRGSLPSREAWEGKFVVSYLGTHGLAHGLDTVLDAARALHSDPEIHFVFAGDGVQRSHLESRAAAMRLENVSFLGPQPRSALPELYRASRIALVPLRDLPMFRTVLPSKLFEILGFGVPVICSVPGEAGDLVQRSGGGVVIPPEDPEALVAAIRWLKATPERLRAMGEAGRIFVLQQHSRPVLAGRMLTILRSVAKGSRAARAPRVRSPA